MERTATPQQGWPPSSLLAHLSADARDDLLTLGAARRYRVRQVLMREGERTTHAILLRAGFVKVTAVADGGRNALIAIRMAGDLIGELGAIDGATARCHRGRLCRCMRQRHLARGVTLVSARHPDASFAIALRPTEIEKIVAQIQAPATDPDREHRLAEMSRLMAAVRADGNEEALQDALKIAVREDPHGFQGGDGEVGPVPGSP